MKTKGIIRQKNGGSLSNKSIRYALLFWLLLAVGNPILSKNRIEETANGRYWMPFDSLFSLIPASACAAPFNPVTAIAYRDRVDVGWQQNENGPYQFDVRWRKVNTETWTSVGGINTRNYTIENLMPNTQYEWQVRRICPDNTESPFTSLGAASTFRTQACKQPQNLRLGYLPDGNPEFTRAAFLWTDANYAPVTFEVQHRPVGDNNWNLAAGITQPNRIVSDLAPGTVYECRVRTVCENQQTSPFSETLIVTTSTCPQPINLLSNYSLLEDRWRAAWTANSGVGYQLRWREVGSIAWTNVVLPANTSQFYFPAFLNRSISYEWQVRTDCASGVLSDYTPSQRFPICNPPVIASISVSHNIATPFWGNVWTLADLQWRAVGETNWKTVSNLPATTTQYSLRNEIEIKRTI